MNNENIGENIGGYVMAIAQFLAPPPSPLEEPQQECRKCGNTLPITHFHLRKSRDGLETVRRKTCRSCTLKQQGKPGRRVRPA